jgi:hypothetical protein
VPAGFEVGAGLVAGKAAQRADEGFLSGIIGLAGVAQDRATQVIDEIEVLRDECLAEAGIVRSHLPDHVVNSRHGVSPF